MSAAAVNPHASTAVVEAPRTSFAARLGPLGITCLVIVGLALVVALIGPLLSGLDPETADLTNAFVGPGQLDGYPLGLDGQGRDVLSRLVIGTRTAIFGPLIVVALALSVGVTLGIVAAWRGGWLDSFLNLGLDVLFGFPGLLLAILAAAVFGGGLFAAGIALAIAYTPYIARVIRGAALRERNMPYVAALYVQGESSWAITTRHILPNVAPIIVAQATILFGYAMVDMVAISFLGLGVQPPDPDWGVMVGENLLGALQGYALPSLLAGTLIVIVVVAVNLLGERLLDMSEGRR